jgi:hypothetical protein
VKGAMEAIVWASMQRRGAPSVVDSVLMRLWKGRYRLK